MAIESASDRTEYVNTFGTPVVINGVSLVAIWDKPYLEELGIATAVPQLMCITTEIPSVAYGQAVTVSSASFTGTIDEIHADGSGMTTLYLKES